MEDKERIAELEKQVDELTDKLIDLQFEKNFDKQNELLEFVRDLFQSLRNVDDKLSKEEIVENLQNYIKEFAKDNNISL